MYEHKACFENKITRFIFDFIKHNAHLIRTIVVVALTLNMYEVYFNIILPKFEISSLLSTSLAVHTVLIRTKDLVGN